MDRPPHAPDPGEGAVLPKGTFDIRCVKAAGPGPQGHFGRRQHLRLGPSHISGNPDEVGGGRARCEMLTREPKGRDLFATRRNCIVNGWLPGHAFIKVSPSLKFARILSRNGHNHGDDRTAKS